LVGKGAYGKIYQVGDYAVKQNFKNCRNWSQSSLREINSLSSLIHPHIVPLISFESNLSLTFPLYKENLLQRLKRDTSEELIRKWFHQLIGAVTFVHSNNYIHRDIKLENILVSNSDDLVLADFGMCVPIESIDQSRYEVICSAWTRAPELFLNNGYNEKIDCWSLGCCLLAITNRGYLFTGNAHDVKEKYEKAVCKGLTINASNDLSTIISNLMILDPIKRQSLHCRLKPYTPIHIQSSIEKWIFQLCNKLVKSEFTLMMIFSLFSMLQYENEEKILFACCCCSLIWKINESMEILPSFWAKACNKKVKDINDTEIKILQQTKGKLICR